MTVDSNLVLIFIDNLLDPYWSYMYSPLITAIIDIFIHEEVHLPHCERMGPKHISQVTLILVYVASLEEPTVQ